MAKWCSRCWRKHLTQGCEYATLGFVMIPLRGKQTGVCFGSTFFGMPPLEGLENDYRLLANEIMRLMLAQELFTFVTAKPVEQLNGEAQAVGATNNE